MVGGAAVLWYNALMEPIGWNERVAPNFMGYELFVTEHDARRNYEEYLALAHVEAVTINLRNSVVLMQWLRGFYGVPYKLTSVFRSPRVNKAVGGSSKSFHTIGLAWDGLPLGVSPSSVNKDWKRTWPGGFKAYNTFCHFDNRGHKARW